MIDKELLSIGSSYFSFRDLTGSAVSDKEAALKTEIELTPNPISAGSNLNFLLHKEKRSPFGHYNFGQEGKKEITFMRQSAKDAR